MERRTRWALAGTAIGLVASVISIVTFVTGFTSVGQMLDSAKRKFSGSRSGLVQEQPPSSTASDVDQQVSPLVAAALTRLEIGQNVDYLIQSLGPPTVTRRQTPARPIGSSDINVELLYYRFSFREACDLQLLADTDHVVVAFVIHGCGYSFPGSQWRVGKTTLSELGEPELRLIGGDAKFPAYVEKHYFGRPGHYHDFYFGGRWPGLSLDISSIPEIDRSLTLVNAVAVVKPPGGLDDSQNKQWDEHFAEIVGVHVTRFEGL